MKISYFFFAMFANINIDKNSLLYLCIHKLRFNFTVERKN